MADQFKNRQVNRADPAVEWFPITPNSAADIPLRPRFLYIGGAGTVVARGSDGVDATFTVAAGAILPIGPARILATSTATGIVGCA